MVDDPDGPGVDGFWAADRLYSGDGRGAFCIYPILTADLSGLRPIGRRFPRQARETAGQAGGGVRPLS